MSTHTVTPAITLQRGCGKGRDPWDLDRFIRGKGLKKIHIARQLAKHHNIISETFTGVRNDRAVLQYLESLGCPQKLLYPLQRPTWKEAA